MIRFIVFVFLTSSVHGGPWKGRPRPLAAPAVDAAQWHLHQRLLAAEPSVLQLSLDVSRLARRTTEESYRRTDEAADRLTSLTASLDKLARRIRPVAPDCVDYKRLRKAQEFFKKGAEDVYRCTHSLSDSAAAYEVEMTERMVAARAQIMDIKQAMRFCQKYQPEVDEQCLHHLEREGHQVIAKLPERARMVVDRAQAEGVAALARLGLCLEVVVSAAHERHLAVTEAIRGCHQESRSGGWQEEYEK